MEDVSAAFRRASAQLQRTVSSVDDRSMPRPTICEVSVRELIEHVLAGNEFAVRLLAGASADDARAGTDQILLGDDPVAQVGASCAAQLRAFADADRSRLLHHPSGDIDYDTFVRFRLGELVIHGWDVAIAADLDPTLDTEVVEDLWRRVEPHLDEMRDMGDAYGGVQEVPLPEGASRQDRLLQAFGRTRQSRPR